jgi:N-acetylglucosamine-6-sulfatase
MAAGAAAMMPGLRAAGSDTRPNIVFLLIDDQRYDAMGFMGKYPWLKTPNMDRLAREGVHFRNSFVTTSLCSPSRASFLTGQYASCHGVMNNATPWLDSNVTFLELLHAAGYDTGFIGKWHMPGKGIPDLTGQGKVDRMVSFSYATGQGVYNDCPLIVDGQKHKQKGYITDVLTEYAIDFLDRKRKSPFCLFLSHKAVHAFFVPPDRYQGVLKDADLPRLQPMTKDLPLGIINKQQRSKFDENVQKYYEALLAVDDSVGAVLDWLDTRGAAENTLVVFVGDNGYFWGEHGLTDKRYPYEEGIRIPHLVRYPALAPDGGRTVSEMALNIDLMPTLLDAAGIDTPRGVQGKSYLGLARGERVAWRDSWLYEYFLDPAFPNPPMKGVRTRDWKYITYPHPKPKKRLPDEMYNLAEDPGEMNDLAGDPAFADKKKELAKELKRLEREAGCRTT